MEAPSESIETNQSSTGAPFGVPRTPPALDRLEPVELAGGRDALAVQGLDLGPAGALVQEGLELVGPAEPDALDLAPDHGLQPQRTHGWIVTGVPSGSVSASRVMVSLSM